MSWPADRRLAGARDERRRRVDEELATSPLRSPPRSTTMHPRTL